MVALRSSLFVTDESAGATCDRLLEESDRYKMKNEHSKKLILEMDAAMRAMSTCLLDIEKKVPTLKTQKKILAKYNAKPLLSAK